jgi:hypothetical protein
MSEGRIRGKALAASTPAHDLSLRVRGKALAASTPAHDLSLRVRVVGPFRSYPDSARVAPERSQLGCPTTEGKVRLCGGI